MTFPFFVLNVLFPQRMCIVHVKDKHGTKATMGWGSVGSGGVLQGIRGQRESACSCTCQGEGWGPGAWMETPRRPSRWEMGAQSSQLPVGVVHSRRAAHPSLFPPPQLLWLDSPGRPAGSPLKASVEPQLYNFWASHSPARCLSFSQLLWSINLGQSQAHNKRCVNMCC